MALTPPEKALLNNTSWAEDDAAGCTRAQKPADAAAPPLRLGPLTSEMLDAAAVISAAAPDPWSRESLRQTLGAEARHCFAAQSGEGALLAFACFLLQGETADLQMLAVAPAARRQGVARRLLAHALAELGALGAARCLLEVRAGNAAALALYGALGFKILARRPGMYAHPPEDGFLMALPLAP